VDPAAQAELYRRGGAGAVSVLTEETYFKGSIGDLESVAAQVDLPVLCKDFIVHESQLDGAHAAGADMVLLIAAILEEEELRRLTRAANALGMTVLHEIHQLDELRKLGKIECAMVGVNARDLSTFRIDRERARATMERLEGNFMKVAESGIGTAHDVRMMRRAGADAFLVGTALMQSGNPASALRELYRGLE
jgi:indole-3-glycerol phosphate synthase